MDGRLVAAQGIGGQRVDDQGGEDGQQAVDDRVEDAAAVQEHVVDHGLVVAQDELLAQVAASVRGRPGRWYAGCGQGDRDRTR